LGVVVVGLDLEAAETLLEILDRLPARVVGLRAERPFALRDVRLAACEDVAPGRKLRLRSRERTLGLLEHGEPPLEGGELCGRVLGDALREVLLLATQLVLAGSDVGLSLAEILCPCGEADLRPRERLACAGGKSAVGRAADRCKRVGELAFLALHGGDPLGELLAHTRELPLPPLPDRPPA